MHNRPPRPPCEEAKWRKITKKKRKHPFFNQAPLQQENYLVYTLFLSEFGKVHSSFSITLSFHPQAADTRRMGTTESYCAANDPMSSSRVGAARLESNFLLAAQRRLRRHSGQGILPCRRRRRGQDVPGAPDGEAGLTVSVWGPEEWGQDAPTMAMLTEPTARQQQQQQSQQRRMGKQEGERPGPIWRSIFGGSFVEDNHGFY